MAVKKFRPTTPSRRQMTMASFEEITTNSPEKSLLVSLKKTGGRNAQGKITVRHRGGGVKRKYRIIDFKRNKDGIEAKVVSIEYDPNRTAYIALLSYADGDVLISLHCIRCIALSFVCSIANTSCFVLKPNTPV